MDKKKKCHTGIKDGSMVCLNCGETQKIPFPMELNFAAGFFSLFDKLQ
jgi:hypothetical protein